MMQPATRIRVKYADEVIEHYDAADTVEEVIIKLINEFGTEKVLRADQSTRSPYNQRLVTTSLINFRSRTYSPYGNVYISRDFNNEDKKRILKDIAWRLGVSMTVEVVSKH